MMTFSQYQKSLKTLGASLLMAVLLWSCAAPPKPEIKPPPAGRPAPAAPPATTPAPPPKLTRKPTPPAMSFIHGCYVQAYRLKSVDHLDQIRYDQFNVFYLVAAHKWTPQDFDMPSSAAIAKLVDGRDFLKLASGSVLTPEFIARAHQHKTIVLMSLQDGDFLSVAKDPNRRACFAKTMAALMKKYDYDGIDLDWENDVDLPLHASLMINLRQAVHELEESDGRRYYLTTALMAAKQYSPGLAAKLAGVTDWINVMTYDIGGGLWGNIATHNTPLPRIQKELADWSVFPANKLCVGLASYGYLYRGLAPGQKSPQPLSAVGRYFYHYELAPLLAAGWKESWDSANSVPYYFGPDRRDFITIDNARSLDIKIRKIHAGRYRGVFWWEYHSDLTAPAAGQQYGTHPLIDPIESYIRKR